MVQDLQDEVERQRSKVSSTVIAEINQTRLELSKTQRSLLSTVS